MPRRRATARARTAVAATHRTDTVHGRSAETDRSAVAADDGDDASAGVAGDATTAATVRSAMSAETVRTTNTIGMIRGTPARR